jgi:hypothetical protein
MNNKEIIQFDKEIKPLIDSTSNVNAALSEAIQEQATQRNRQNDLMAEIDALASKLGVARGAQQSVPTNFRQLDIEVNEYCNKYSINAKSFPSLSPAEWIYCSVVGILSVAVDVIFVGTPEVVKLYRGGDTFDGSVLTGLLRSISSEPNSRSYVVTHWLSDKCKVPYDLSAVKNVMNPNNHRLRSLGHDPFLGLFFAVGDILMGTTTCVDNDGHLRVLVGKHQANIQERLLSVLYYIGHIFSDICTARGIPIPGFFLTQFFAGDGSSDSVAAIAQSMYLDGYDMRHLASTSIPVAVKNLLIDAYLYLDSEQIKPNMLGIAQRELQLQNRTLKREKMLFISNCVATSGNIAKVLLPPNCGNPAAINLAQWEQLINSSIVMASAAARDMTVENAVAQRENIDKTWDKLLPSE